MLSPAGADSAASSQAFHTRSVRSRRGSHVAQRPDRLPDQPDRAHGTKTSREVQRLATMKDGVKLGAMLANGATNRRDADQVMLGGCGGSASAQSEGVRAGGFRLPCSREGATWPGKDCRETPAAPSRPATRRSRSMRLQGRTWWWRRIDPAWWRERGARLGERFAQREIHVRPAGRDA